jgi:hypothetical protein
MSISNIGISIPTKKPNLDNLIFASSLSTSFNSVEGKSIGLSNNEFPEAYVDPKTRLIILNFILIPKPR